MERAMHFKRTLSAMLALSAVAGTGYADTEYPTDNAPETKDVQFLRNWFKTKRAVSIQEKGGDLSISGAVRFDYNGRTGKIGSNNKVYDSSTQNLAKNEFKSRVDLFFDYRTCHTWAHIKLKFNNKMGIINGTTNKLVLEKAIFGYRVFDNGKSAIVDLEAGRTKLYNFFDSKIQYNAMLDGASLRFADSFDRVFDLDARYAFGIVSYQDNQYVHVGEVDFMDVAETGLYFKYSYTHWRKHGSSSLWETGDGGGPWSAIATLSDNPQFKFQISQFLLGYAIDPEVLRFPLKIYGAFLMNHAAEQISSPVNITSKDRNAWYMGFTAGQVAKRGDWSLEVVYQAVGAQSVPDFDMAGIGNANEAGSLLYAFKSPGTALTPFGNTNFKGWTGEFMVGLTNNISLLVQIDWSKQRKAQIGTAPLTYDYRRAGVSAIYAF
jgi:hypothetical protein